MDAARPRPGGDRVTERPIFRTPDEIAQAARAGEGAGEGGAEAIVRIRDVDKTFLTGGAVVTTALAALGCLRVLFLEEELVAITIDGLGDSLIKSHVVPTSHNTTTFSLFSSNNKE
jgi:hypothetical protein